MAPLLKIYTLGGVQFLLGEHSVADIANRKAEALLIYLAATRRPQSREVLADLLWDERSQSQVLSNLRTVLTILRRHFEAYLLVSREAVALDPQAAVWTDVGEFEVRLEVARSGKAAGGVANVQALQSAVDLYRGDFLAGFHVRDCRGFEEWLVGQRERLHQAAVDALQELIALHIQAAAYPAGLAAANRLLQIDPLNESAHRQAMVLLACSGQRGAALARYEACQKLLWEELGVEPSPETQALYQQIRSGELGDRISLPGSVKGYEIKEQIGAGSFGAVYRAWQPSVQREVAVKVILPPYASDPDFIRRFESEAQLIARLEHPHIVPLYDFWREPQGAYLVMRWLRGGSLQRLLEKGPLKVEQVTSMLEQIASGLAAAHQKGVLHRDLKPANILLDEGGNAYLSDFGIARKLSQVMQRAASQGPAGSPVYMSPEQLCNQALSPQTDIYTLGVLLYEMLAGKPPFEADSLVDLIEQHLHAPPPRVSQVRPELPPQVDHVIERSLAKEPAQRYPDALTLADEFIQALGEYHPAGERLARPSFEPANPYKGLRPFEEVDSADFFGREALTQQLLRRLEEKDAYHRFLAVVGPSGSGKSSAVKAGLIPALRRGALPGSEKWYIAEMCPHSYPLDELEVALLRLSANPDLKLSEQLQRDRRGLLRAARLILPNAHSQLLLVVDQFEELFTLADRTEARYFMDLLYQAVSDPYSPLRVVIMLRADFYDRPLMEQEFSALVGQRTEAVVPLSGEELERAVRCPAEQAGVAFEAGLVTEIVAQVVEQAGALPLLQYALTELFEMREGRTLTQAGYQAIGGVLGALWGRAETVYQGLDGVGQALARQIFLRMVTLGEGVEDTRRRVLIAELQSLVEQPLSLTPDPLNGTGDGGQGLGELEVVLSAFGSARLLTFDHDPGTRASTVEIAHEALLKEWDRLKDWLEASRADIRLQRLLASSAAEWQASGKDPSFLLRGARLAQFVEWTGTASLALTGEERAYLQASLAERRREEAEEAARRANEIRLERRSRKFLYGLVVVFAVAAVVALGLTWLARRAQSQAVAEANSRATQQVIAESEAEQRATQQVIAENEAASRATQQAIAEDARREADEQRQAALLQASAGLAAQALAELEGAQPERAVLMALAALEQYPYTPQAESALAQAVQQVYPYQDFAPSLEEVPEGAATSMVFSPDDRQIIAYFSGYDTSWVISIDVASGEIVRSIQLDSFCGYVSFIGGAPLALSPDGKHVTVLHQNDPACPFAIWDLERGEKMFTLSDEPQVAAYDAAWSPDGRFILTGSLDGVARVWDAASGEVLLQLSGYSGPVRAVGWSPDGQRLVTGGEDGTLRVWDAQSGQQISSAQGHMSPVLSLDWSPSGEFLASGGADGVAQVWEAATGQLRQSLRGHTDQISAVAWSADGDRLATTSLDGTTRLWNPQTGEQLLQSSNVTNYQSVDWSSQGDRLVNTGGWGLRIWELPPRTLRLVGHTGGGYDAQWSPDGGRIATGSQEDGTVRIWDWPGGQLLKTLDNPGYYLAWSPDGRRLAIANFGAEFSVWDTVAWQRLWELPGSTDDSLFVPAWSPDGERLAAVGAPAFYALVLDGESGEELTRIDSDRPGWLFMRPQSWAPQGDRFVAGTLVFSDEKTPARVWDAASGEILLELPAQEGSTVMGAYSPDGRYIATLSSPGVVRVWDAENGELVSPGVGLSGDVQDLHWSPNGDRIAVGNADGVVVVLEAMTGAQVAIYPVSKGPVTSVDWSPDGKSLVASLLTNSQPYIFPAWQSTDDLIAYARECCVWRELTAEERTQFGLPIR